jgi:hypothetical protein
LDQAIYHILTGSQLVELDFNLADFGTESVKQKLAVELHHSVLTNQEGKLAE